MPSSRPMDWMQPFTDPAAVARYTDGPPRLVPGFADLQRMALILLAERASEDADILVLGAGGGLELKTFAQARPGWHLTGVDPSAAMLSLARATLGPLASQVEFCEGYIDAAPPGPFDGATCLLTLHFLPLEQRLRTLLEVRKRLKRGATFVMAHHSFAEGGDEHRRWLSRFAAFATLSGLDPARTMEMARAISDHLPVIAPDREEALLSEAGFRDTALFYAAFTFRGWVEVA